MYDDEDFTEDPQTVRKVALDPTISLLTSDIEEPIKGKSIIARWERDVYAQVLSYAEDWGIPFLKDLVIQKMKLAPSVDGKAREEVVTIMAGHKPEVEKRSLLNKVMKRENY